MTLMLVAAFVCALWWFAALVILLGSALLAVLEPILRRKPNLNASNPALSVIIPIKDMTPDFEPAFVSLFSQAYPDFEVLVSAAEKTSPAIECARGVAARYPAITTRFITGKPDTLRNPKINNLAAPIMAASHDLVVVKDSNIRLPNGRLSEMIAYLSGDTGLVASVAIGREPKNFSADVECAALNGYVARFLLAASALGIGFGIGATVLFSRRDFERAGGIARVADAIGEDHAISKMLAAIGRKTATVGTVEQVIGRRRFSDVWNRQLRWAICRRCEEPVAFYAEFFTSPLIAAFAGAGAAAMIGAPTITIFTATLAVAVAAEMLLAAIKGWPLSWRSPFAALCYLILFPVLWMQARFARKIFWGNVSLAISRPIIEN
jgi:ceramide glucosyltransferase